MNAALNAKIQFKQCTENRTNYGENLNEKFNLMNHREPMLIQTVHVIFAVNLFPGKAKL
jgi:hypothetical protein